MMFTVRITIRRSLLRLPVTEVTVTRSSVAGALAAAIAGVLPGVPGGWQGLMRAVRDLLPHRRPLADPVSPAAPNLATEEGRALAALETLKGLPKRGDWPKMTTLRGSPWS
jgi:hypothetical protein